MMHVGLVDFDVMEPGDRIEFDVAQFRALSHDLLVDLGFGRHIDHDVALEQVWQLRRRPDFSPRLSS